MLMVLSLFSMIIDIYKGYEMIKNHHKRLGEILYKYGIITKEELTRALREQKIRNKRIGEILIELNMVKQDQINWVLSQQLDIPYIQIDTAQLDIELIKKFPGYLIKNYNVIPLIEVNGTLVVAMSDPTDEEALQKIKAFYKKEPEVSLSSFKNIREIIQYLKKEFPDLLQ